MSAIDWRAEARRYALPVLLLLLATVAGLVIRAALAEDTRSTERAEPVARAKPRSGVKRAAVRFHLVESGDTLGGIAGRYGTTVARLRALNAGVDPAALRVGQQIRLPASDR